MTPVTAKKPPEPQTSEKLNISHQASPCKAKFKSKNLDYDQGDGDFEENGLIDVMRRQNEITEQLVKQHQAALLPAREIHTFYSDALQYQSFIMASEQGIECKVNNVQYKLFYLEQYTKGAPNQLPPHGPRKGAQKSKRAT